MNNFNNSRAKNVTKSRTQCAASLHAGHDDAGQTDIHTSPEVAAPLTTSACADGSSCSDSRPPYRHLPSAPEHQAVSQTSTRVASATCCQPTAKQGAACCAAASSACADDSRTAGKAQPHGITTCSRSQLPSAPEEQCLTSQQQQHGTSPNGSRATQESPCWLLHTAMHGARSAPAATRARHGPMHAESSLYADWAARQAAAGSTGRSGASAAAMLTRSPPTSPSPSAAQGVHVCRGGFDHSAAARSSPSQPGSSCAAPKSRGGSPSSLQTMPYDELQAQAAATAALAAAASLPGHPCSSNYHSSKAAAIAAGISRPGSVSPEHHAWFRQQHSRAPLPRREDTQQLWQWLAEELNQLKQQLQQPSVQLQQDMELLHPSTASPASSLPGQHLSQQHARPARSDGRSATAPSRASAAADTASGGMSPAATSSSSRAASPARQRGQSPSRLQTSDGDSPASTSADALGQQAQELTQLCKGAGGALQPTCLQLQLDLYSAAFNELCR